MKIVEKNATISLFYKDLILAHASGNVPISSVGRVYTPKIRIYSLNAISKG